MIPRHLLPILRFPPFLALKELTCLEITFTQVNINTATKNVTVVYKSRGNTITMEAKFHRVSQQMAISHDNYVFQVER